MLNFLSVIITLHLYMGMPLDQRITLVSFFLLFKMKYNLHRIMCTVLSILSDEFDKCLSKYRTCPTSLKGPLCPFLVNPDSTMPSHPIETIVLISITKNHFCLFMAFMEMESYSLYSFVSNVDEIHPCCCRHQQFIIHYYRVVFIQTTMCLPILLLKDICIISRFGLL